MRTTIQLSENLRKKLRVLASLRDLSYDEVIDDMISIFKSSIPFETEGDFALWFENNFKKLGFKEIVEKTKATDYKVIDGNGKRKSVKLELIGEDFIRHKHDPKVFDLVVCVYSDTDSVNGVPVVAVVDPESLTKQMFEPKKKQPTVMVPEQLYKKVNDWIKSTGFSSVSDFTTYVLREIIASGTKGKDVLTKNDEIKIRERLRALGYIS
jgi:Arc/MetJ-type ribon-helix-helix transcriptional regulator